VFAAIGWLPKASHMDALEETYRIARAQALIALGSTVPGYWFTVFTIDRLGRKTIQVGGFILMTLFMAALAGFYIPLRDHHTNGFVTMYALTFFFSNFGPNGGGAHRPKRWGGDPAAAPEALGCRCRAAVEFCSCQPLGASLSLLSSFDT
jgi:hypothetical protein